MDPEIRVIFICQYIVSSRLYIPHALNKIYDCTIIQKIIVGSLIVEI
jgi:hypothetical protein